uniref:Retrotransposon gag domain-containing protein n=1 Tax=Meloidogyne incognita TaxID=6306 RepID=A0A914N6U6_MELIC
MDEGDIAVIDQKLFTGKTGTPKFTDLEAIISNTLMLENSINLKFQAVNRRLNSATEAITTISDDLNTGLHTLAKRIDDMPQFTYSTPKPNIQPRITLNREDQNLNVVGSSIQQQSSTLKSIHTDDNNIQDSDPEDDNINNNIGTIAGLTFDYNIPNSHGPIPIYSGESSGTFSSWAQKFLDYIEGTAQKLDEPSKIGRLKMFLDGIPRQVLEELPPEDKNTLIKAIESLKRSLDTPIRAQLAKQSLSLCRQKEDESIDRFVDRLVPLIFAAYPEQNPQSRKDILKAAFLDKIKEEIAFYVRVGITPQQSFEEVRIKALEVENLIQTRKRKHENEEWLSAISQINQQVPSRFPSGNFSTWQNDSNQNRKTVGFSDAVNRNYSPSPRNSNYSRLQEQPRNNNFSNKNYSPRGNSQPNSFARNFNQPRNFNQSFGRQPNMNNFKICNYCHKAGHLISECYTRLRNYGPYQNTIRARNPNFQQPFRNASYPRNQNNYTSQYNSGRINTLDVHNLPNHFNNLDINHGPHNIKTLSINEQPEIKPNASNPTNYPTELNKPEEINRASEIERWEPPLSKSNYSIAPFITRLSTIFLLILIIPGYFAYPQIPANLNYKPNSPMVCQTEQRGEYWSLPEFAPCPRIKPNLTGSPVPQNI